MKNRVHVDLATTSTTHQAELVTRLKDLGATPADVGQGDVTWTVMADPEGNEFCVLDPRPLYRDTGPIAAVVVDCADPRAMARFWGKAMDWTLHKVTDHNAVLRSAKGVGPYLQFLRTPDAKTGWNRVHLDVRPYPDDDLAAEAARLRTLGAVAVDLGQSDVPWTVLADPEGNEFCLLAQADPNPSAIDGQQPGLCGAPQAGQPVRRLVSSEATKAVQVVGENVRVGPPRSLLSRTSTVLSAYRASTHWPCVPERVLTRHGSPVRRLIVVLLPSLSRFEGPTRPHLG